MATADLLPLDDAFANHLEAIHAYDCGAADSGVRDEPLRCRLIEALHQHPERAVALFLSRFVRDRYLSEPAIAQGHAILDVREFIDWLRDYMAYDI